MEYEIHITVENNENFIKTCEEIGVKPIIIVVNETKKETNQVMTSSKHSGTSWREVMNSLTKRLIDNNQKIIRQKVEIFPQEEKYESHIYYESHIRLKLIKNYDRSSLLKICNEMDFHISRNLFKKNNEFDWLMITYRKNNIKLSDFKSDIDRMKKLLNNLEIEYDKIEIEECIFDSNENLDKEWLK